MAITPKKRNELIQGSIKKSDIEAPPEPMIVPIKRINEYSTDTVGEIMSNTRLGLERYPMFSIYPFWLGVAFAKEFDQYVIITTSKNKGDWEQENVAYLRTDERVLETIIKQRKEELLEEPEFKRLKEFKEEDRR